MDQRVSPRNSVDMKREPTTASLTAAEVDEIRCMPGTSHFDRGLIEPGDGAGDTVDFSTWPLWLLRGADKTGKKDFQIGHT